MSMSRLLTVQGDFAQDADVYLLRADALELCSSPERSAACRPSLADFTGWACILD
jgi:hypothetical protein